MVLATHLHAGWEATCALMDPRTLAVPHYWDSGLLD